MTLVVGWIHAGSAFLVADSIETRREPIEAIPLADLPDTVEDEPSSSIGESHPDPNVTAENAIKVFQLGSCAAGAFAGSVRSGCDYLESVQTRCTVGSTARAAIEQIVVPDGISVLIAEASAHGASIFRISVDETKEAYAEDDVQIAGSASEPHKCFIEALVRGHIRDPAIARDADHLLAAVLAVIQVQGARVNSLDIGIGGAFFGLRCSTTGVARHQDIGFVLLDPKALPAIQVQRWLMTGWRDVVAFSDTILPAPGPGGVQRQIRTRARTINPIDEAEGQQITRALMEAKCSPRYIACVDPRTSAMILFEQNAYTAQHLGHFSADATGIDAAIGPALQKLVANLPTPEEVQHARQFPLHFIVDEQDIDRLRRNGWFD